VVENLFYSVSSFLDPIFQNHGVMILQAFLAIFGSAIIDFVQRRLLNRLARQLEMDGLSATAIHGNKSQGARTRALADFKNGAVRILVATDIAARGLDIDQLPHVVNYELPNVPEDYVHRIGRTGRAGREGVATSLVSADEQKLLRDIERLLKREVPSEILPGYECKPGQRSETVSNGNRNGARSGNRNGSGNGGRSNNRNGNGNGKQNGQNAGRKKPAHAQGRGRSAPRKTSVKPGYSSLANRIFSE